MNKKTKKWLTYVVTTLAAALVIMTAAGKIIAPKDLVDHYAQLSLVSYMKVLGTMELLFVAAFLYRPTMKIGFMLLTAYFGGAIATELSHGQAIFFPLMILVLVWIAAALKRPDIFSLKNQPKQTFSLT